MRVVPRITAYYIGRAIQGGLTVASQVIVFKLFGAAVFADIGFFALLPTLLAVADQLFLNEVFASLDWSSGPCLVHWSRIRQTATLNVAYALGISAVTSLALWLMHHTLGNAPDAHGYNPAYLLLACSSSALWWSVSFWTNYAAAIDKPILSQCVGISAPLGRCLVPIGTFAFRVKESIDTHLYVINGIAALILLLVWATYFARRQKKDGLQCADTPVASRKLLTHLWNLVRKKHSILLASASASAYNMVDKVIFWSVLPKTLYGEYLLISQLVALVSLFSGPLYSAMVPVLNRLFQASDPIAFRKLLGNTLLGTVFALATISVIGMAGSNQLLYRAFGHASTDTFLRLAFGTALSSYLAWMTIYVPWAVLCFRDEAQHGADIFAWVCVSYLAIGIVCSREHLTRLILPANMLLSLIQASLILRRLRAAVWGGRPSGLVFRCYPTLMVVMAGPGIASCWNANWHHF